MPIGSPRRWRPSAPWSGPAPAGRFSGPPPAPGPVPPRDRTTTGSTAARAAAPGRAPSPGRLGIGPPQGPAGWSPQQPWTRCRCPRRPCDANHRISQGRQPAQLSGGERRGGEDRRAGRCSAGNGIDGKNAGGPAQGDGRGGGARRAVLAGGGVHHHLGRAGSDVLVRFHRPETSWAEVSAVLLHLGDAPLTRNEMPHPDGGAGSASASCPSSGTERAAHVPEGCASPTRPAGGRRVVPRRPGSDDGPAPPSKEVRGRRRRCGAVVGTGGRRGVSSRSGSSSGRPSARTP